MEVERSLLLIAERSELVDSFPDWLLPSKTIDDLRRTPGVAIAEIAGRDSIAAVLLAVERYPIKAILPTIAYTGTEFGNWQMAIEKGLLLAERLREHGVKTFHPIFLGAPKFWSLLSGRYISYLFKHFGFYTPCLGCHLYLHALRIPIARLIGSRFIIAGERERHDGRIKINQLGVALDAYVKFVLNFGVNLLLPLRHIYVGKEIERIVGQGWEEGTEQLQCVLSKNYQDVDDTVTYDEGAIRRFFDEFAVPVAEQIVQDYLNGKSPEYENQRPGSFHHAKSAECAPSPISPSAKRRPSA